MSDYTDDPGQRLRGKNRVRSDAGFPPPPAHDFDLHVARATEERNQILLGALSELGEDNLGVALGVKPNPPTGRRVLHPKRIPIRDFGSWLSGRAREVYETRVPCTLLEVDSAEITGVVSRMRLAPRSARAWALRGGGWRHPLRLLRWALDRYLDWGDQTRHVLPAVFFAKPVPAGEQWEPYAARMAGAFQLLVRGGYLDLAVLGPAFRQPLPDGRQVLSLFCFPSLRLGLRAVKERLPAGCITLLLNQALGNIAFAFHEGALASDDWTGL